MATEADVLKEFLVSLGFSIDPSSERKFVDAIAAATVKAVALGVAVQGAATLVVAGVAKISDGLERLYFASERTKASAGNIQAYSFEIGQLGGSAEGALGSLENIMRLLRESPGGEGLLKNLGVQTRAANGELRDSVEMLGDLSKRLAVMPYYRANAYAKALGIDERTLMAMRQGLGEFGEEYKNMARAAGFDAQDAAKGAHEFMNELRLLGAAATVLVQKIASLASGRLKDSMRGLRETFVANFDRIAAGVGGILKVLLRVTEAVSIMAMRGAQAIGRLVEWFEGLSQGSQNIIKWFGLALVAWRVLNAGFLATPLGRILAMASALALLWDDYQTWKEGGKSLIDWKAWAPGIEAAISGIERIGEWLHKALEFTGDWRPALEVLLAYFAGTWVLGMLGSLTKLLLGFGTAATGLTAGITAASAAWVAAAGVAGYAAGSWFSKKFLEGTKAQDVIGESIADVLAFFGNSTAKESLANAEKARKAGVLKPPPAPSAIDGVTPLVSDKPVTPAPPMPVHTPAGRRTPATEGVMRLPAPVPTVAPPGTSERPPAPPLRAPTAPSPNVWGKERGLRNNNPGNIEYGKFAKDRGAVGPEAGEGRFAMFKDAQDGLDALVALLKSYAGRGIDSVQKIITKYAPPSDKNNTPAYIETVANKLGVKPDQKLNLQDPTQLRGMVDAVVRVENGRNPYTSEMMNKATGAPQAAGRPVEIKQTTSITVTGGGDAHAVARDVTAGQDKVNDQLMRNLRGAVLQ